MSVRKLTKDGYKLIFEKNGCQIKKDCELKAIAEPSSNLYKVKIIEKAYAAISAVLCANYQYMWQRHFGHRDPEAIKQLAGKDLAFGVKIENCGLCEICECCVKEKISRAPFPMLSEIKSTDILDLIDTDVCGPMQTITPGKKRYVLTIIDDYSIYTHICLLRYKSEVSAIIKQYVEWSKT